LDAEKHRTASNDRRDYGKINGKDAEMVQKIFDHSPQ
jgi:hypothetical protein